MLYEVITGGADRGQFQDGGCHRSGGGGLPYAGTARCAAVRERIVRCGAQSDLFHRRGVVAVRPAQSGPGRARTGQ